MLVSDDEVNDLKAWIVRRLEDISDADSDVLADYVLALIRAEAPENDIKANAIENLEDFLRDNTTVFVDEIFEVIRLKSFIPDYVPPSISPGTPPAQAIPTIVPTVLDGADVPIGSFLINTQSRKRSYNDANESSQGHDPHYGHGERSMKHNRRGGNTGHSLRANFNNGQTHGFQPASTAQIQLPGMPGQPPNMPFNPSEMMAAMSAMQAMGMPLPPIPTAGSPPVPHGGRGGGALRGGKNRINARCRDYDTKGVCYRGAACPFTHGDGSVVAPPPSQEYDPKTPTLDVFPSPFSNIHSISPTSTLPFTQSHHRGGAHGSVSFQPPQSRNGTHSRSEFSITGGNYDPSNTTVVVEQIPEENFAEAQVRDFFSSFGNIEEVTMKPYKRLAIVKFDSYDAARAVYHSPKVIFNNRFVKVYWYKPDANAATTSTTNGAPQKSNSVAAAIADAAKGATGEAGSHEQADAYDKEKFQRDAEAAQKKLDERKAVEQETKKKIAEIEAKQAELNRMREEEIRRMKEKLAAKGQSMNLDAGSSSAKKSISGPSAPNGESSAEKTKKEETTQKLLAQLHALEDEARSLGINPDEGASAGPGFGRGSGMGRGRGRGGYRGYNYDPSYSSRGSYRGRGGSFRGVVRAGGAYNLDNRSKKVKVEGVVFDTGKEEALKQFLFGVGEFTSVTPPTPASRSTAHIIAFKDRSTAEKFFFGPRDIPDVGKLEFSWITEPLPPVPTTAQTSSSKDDGDTVMGGVGSGDDPALAGGAGGKTTGVNGGVSAVMARGEEERELDYDVAEEEQWVVE